MDMAQLQTSYHHIFMSLVFSPMATGENAFFKGNTS